MELQGEASRPRLTILTYAGRMKAGPDIRRTILTYAGHSLPMRVAVVVALAAWAYILAANTTRWRAALELSPGGVVHPVANASTVACSDHDFTANISSSRSLGISVDDVRRDAIRAEFVWSWHAVRHVGD